MPELIVRPVASAAEYDMAYQLALGIFDQHSTMEGYSGHKHFLWTHDPSADYQNILLAWYDGTPAGLIRVVPRVICRVDQIYSVAGISSVCIRAELQGKGLSVPLMEQSLELCKERGFEIAFLFARRAADHYYTRFGFWGVASHARVSVKIPATRDKSPDFTLSPADIELAGMYAAAYDRSYKNCFGRIQRTDAHWRFLLASFEYRKDCTFYTISAGGLPSGYMVWDGKKILEVAMDGPIEGPAVVAFLKNSVCPGEAAIEMEMLPQHTLVKSFEGLDTSFQSRECSYGGHMARILNRESVIKKMADRSRGSYPDMEKITGRAVLTHHETCSLLGIFSPSLQDHTSQDALPFDICSLDHF